MAGEEGAWGRFPFSSQPLPADTLGTTLPNMSLQLEVRPQTATGLLFHLGQLQATPYLQAQVLGKQVSQWGL